MGSAAFFCSSKLENAWFSNNSQLYNNGPVEELSVLFEGTKILNKHTIQRLFFPVAVSYAKVEFVELFFSPRLMTTQAMTWLITTAVALLWYCLTKTWYDEADYQNSYIIYWKLQVKQDLFFFFFVCSNNRLLLWITDQSHQNVQRRWRKQQVSNHAAHISAQAVKRSKCVFSCKEQSKRLNQHQIVFLGKTT